MRLFFSLFFFLRNRDIFFFKLSVKRYLQKSLRRNEKIMNRNCTWSCLSVVLRDGLSGSTRHGTIGRVSPTTGIQPRYTRGNVAAIRAADLDEMKRSVQAV